MKQSSLVVFTALVLGFSGCSDDGDGQDGPPATGGSGLGASPGAGGGSSPGAGGSLASGGAAGGSIASGGAAGGNVASGGAAVGGASSGGSSAGGAASGGAQAGGASADGGSPALTPEDLVADLDGYLYTGDCDGGGASFECPLTNCSGGVFKEQAVFKVSGDPEVTYELTLHVYGVVELRSDYAGGERRQGATDNAESGKDFWYEGGSYTPGAGYNVYGLRVTPAVEDVPNADEEGNNYFLNARDSSGEGHQVWEINTEAVVPVKGEGTIEFTAYDPNCLQIMNNAETAQPSGSGPGGSIVIDLEDSDPEPTEFEQPLSSDGRTGQWIYIDVVSVSER